MGAQQPHKHLLKTGQAIWGICRETHVILNSPALDPTLGPCAALIWSSLLAIPSWALPAHMYLLSESPLAYALSVPDSSSSYHVSPIMKAQVSEVRGVPRVVRLFAGVGPNCLFTSPKMCTLPPCRLRALIKGSVMRDMYHETNCLYSSPGSISHLLGGLR